MWLTAKVAFKYTDFNERACVSSCEYIPGSGDACGFSCRYGCASSSAIETLSLGFRIRQLWKNKAIKTAYAYIKISLQHYGFVF